MERLPVASADGDISALFFGELNAQKDIMKCFFKALCQENDCNEDRYIDFRADIKDIVSKLSRNTKLQGNVVDYYFFPYYDRSSADNFDINPINNFSAIMGSDQAIITLISIIFSVDIVLYVMELNNQAMESHNQAMELHNQAMEDEGMEDEGIPSDIAWSYPVRKFVYASKDLPSKYCLHFAVITDDSGNQRYHWLSDKDGNSVFDKESDMSMNMEPGQIFEHRVDNSGDLASILHRKQSAMNILKNLEKESAAQESFFQATGIDNSEDMDLLQVMMARVKIILRLYS